MNVPDLSSESPLIISGRYKGNFPDVLKARGIIADMTSYEMELKVYKAKAIPLEKVRGQNFHVLLTNVWFLYNKQRFCYSLSLLTDEHTCVLSFCFVADYLHFTDIGSAANHYIHISIMAFGRQTT